MSKFLDRLNEGKDEKAAKQNALVEADAKAQVEQKISGLVSQGKKLEAAYEQAFGSANFSIDRVIALTKEIADNTSNLALAKSILEKEF